MAKKSLVCTVCDRRFALPAHLGRHMSSMHGAVRKSAPRGRARSGWPTASAGLGMARLTEALRARRNALSAELAGVQSQLAMLESVLTRLSR